jgi:DNA repair protein RecN (Recombination protein N)
MSFFTDNDLDYSEEECLLRREINPAGKSRSFINDTPVPLSTLRQLSERLIDIHSQHATLLLQDSRFQLQLIDQYAHLQPELDRYRKSYREHLRLQQEQRQLQTDGMQDSQYFQFLFQEFEDAKLKEGEQRQLEEELERLTHAEDIKQSLYESACILDDGEDNLIGRLREVRQKLQHAARYHGALQALADRIESAQIELEDLTNEIRREQDRTDYRPERAEQVRERLNLLYSLQQKHQVPDEAGLLQKEQEIRQQLQNAEAAAAAKEAVQQQLEQCRQQMAEAAAQLHKHREAALPEMQQTLAKRLVQMKMPHGRVEIRLHTTTFNEYGEDEADFLFSANAGIPPLPLAKIASGGEMSRVMLAVKALISQKNVLPTILFDEIDSGVSGEVTSNMADVMRDIATYSQVIAITHQAQIAAKAGTNYLVYKETSDGTTCSNIRRLSPDERRKEIARMVGDGALTEASLQLADVLIEGGKR